MTLDEAIEHAREVERTCGDTRCAAEHSQLAEWLNELRQWREKSRDLERENAKLYEICADMLRTMKHTTGPYIQTNHHTLLTEVFRDGKPTNVQVSLTSLEERYEQRLREIGIEV